MGAFQIVAFSKKVLLLQKTLNNIIYDKRRIFGDSSQPLRNCYEIT
jgi:hypothetical protein